MMKKVLSSVILLAAVNASAGENYFSNEWDAKGLIAIGGSGGSMSLANKMEDSNGYKLVSSENSSFSSATFKMGGESKDYRLFLDGTYYMFDAENTTSSTAYSLGIQIDYLVRAGEHFNIFMGLNGGGMYTEFQAEDASTPAQTYYVDGKNAYAGAQLGVNIDIIDSLGIELGGRFKHVFTGNNQYAIENLYEGYATLVFKFTGEY